MTTAGTPPETQPGWPGSHDEPAPAGAEATTPAASSNPWAMPASAPNRVPNPWNTYPGAPGTWTVPRYSAAPPYAAPYSMPPATQPKNASGGWVRFLAALALVAVLGLGISAGAVVALGWNGARSVSNVTSQAGTTSGAGTTVAASSSSDTLEQSVEAAVQAAQPSVVEITSVSGRQEAVGSGDILNTNGYIVTNDHVVAGFRSFTVTLSDGTKQTAQLVGQDAQDDLAVLKIAASASLHPIAVADSSSVQLGQFAIAVGNPLALGESASLGIISALNRTASEAPDGPAGEMTGLIQTSAPLNPGNSGGALVNLQGQLIGMPTLGAIDPETNTAADGIGYAIPSNRVVSVANQLIQTGGATAG